MVSAENESAFKPKRQAATEGCLISQKNKVFDIYSSPGGDNAEESMRRVARSVHKGLVRCPARKRLLRRTRRTWEGTIEIVLWNEVFYVELARGKLSCGGLLSVRQEGFWLGIGYLVMNC